MVRSRVSAFFVLFFFFKVIFILRTELFNKTDFTSSSPLSTPKKARNHDLLINNFNCLIEQQQQQETGSSIKNLFNFYSTASSIDEQPQYDEDELLRKLMLKLKKFSNKLKNNEGIKDGSGGGGGRRKKRGIKKIKRKKLVYNKKNSKFLSKKRLNQSKKKINSPEATEIVKSPNSSIVRNLLNDSRGISKYMINYDLTEYTESPSVINRTTRCFYYDNTFDNINLDLQFEDPLIQLEDLKHEYSFNNDDTIVKSSNCSSGYLSD